MTIRNEIRTMMIFNWDNHNNIEGIMHNHHFPFYKPESADGYVVFNILLDDAERFALGAGLRSFAFIGNDNGKLTIRTWSKEPKREQGIFAIPPEISDPGNEKLNLLCEKCRNRPVLLEESLDKKYTAKYRWMIRNDIYGVPFLGH